MKRDAPIPAKQFLLNLRKGPNAVPDKPEKTPGAARKKPNTSVANGLTKAIIRMLLFKRCDAWRNNNGAVYDPVKEIFRSGNTRKGLPDILGVGPGGFFIAIEVKAPGDTLSPEQRLNLFDWAKLGAFTCEGCSISQVEAEYDLYLLARSGGF